MVKVENGVDFDYALSGKGLAKRQGGWRTLVRLPHLNIE